MIRLVVRVAETDADRAACFAIRRTVFVEEQGVPPDAELDRHDAVATHLLAVGDDRPIGTMRWRVAAPDTAKVERVAVLGEARGLGVGASLMIEALRQIAEAGLNVVVLHAQLSARAFYERLGFRVEGQSFTEEGIEHVRMVLAMQGSRDASCRGGEPAHQPR